MRCGSNITFKVQNDSIQVPWFGKCPLNSARSFASWNIANFDSRLRTAMVVSLVAILCYLGDRLAYVLGVPPDQIASLWPSTPLLVAVLLLTPRRIWPLLIAAGLGGIVLADLRNGASISEEIWFSLGNACEVFIAIVGINLLFKGAPQLTSVKTLAKYLAVGVILAPFVAGLVGAIANVSGYWLQWRLWFFADALAFLTVTPAILTWARGGRIWGRKSLNYLELAALMILLLLFGYLTFISAGRWIQPALLYSLVPLLLWAALRLGLKGVSTSMIVIAFLSVGGAAHGRGPFAQQGALNSVLSIQLFLFFVAMPFMFLAVLVEEQKIAVEVLRESEGRFRAVANTAPVMIWMSGPDRVCTYCNKPWMQFTGRQLEAELGNRWEESVHPEDRQACAEAYTQAFDRCRSFTSEYRLRRHDGEYRWILTTVVPRFELADSFAGYISSAVDVTDRKRAEESLSSLSGRLIEAQEQERRRIARELHDDISQKLVLLSIELQQFAGSLPDSPARLRNQIEPMMKRISEISSDTHALSHRLHSSKLETLGLVAAMRGFCRELAEQRDVKIDFTHSEVPDILPPHVSLCLFRVLQEGLSNAVKHSGVRRFNVQLEGVLHQLQLTIRDAGAGFDPCMAIHNDGLGLISMRERISNLKGTISIVSKPHGGTEIRVRVPVGVHVEQNQMTSSA
jgi:PAS domain S-box-containing protein